MWGALLTKALPGIISWGMKKLGNTNWGKKAMSWIDDKKKTPFMKAIQSGFKQGMDEVKMARALQNIRKTKKIHKKPKS